MLSTTIELRFATVSDNPNVSDFVLIALNDSTILRNCSEHIGSDFLTRLGANEFGNLLLAFDNQNNNAIIGFLELDPSKSVAKKNHFIANIYVLPRYRSRGIASSLVHKILEEKCTNGEELVVEVNDERERKYLESLHFNTKNTILKLKL